MYNDNFNYNSESSSKIWLKLAIAGFAVLVVSIILFVTLGSNTFFSIYQFLFSVVALVLSVFGFYSLFTNKGDVDVTPVTKILFVVFLLVIFAGSLSYLLDIIGVF